MFKDDIIKEIEEIDLIDYIQKLGEFPIFGMAHQLFIEDVVKEYYKEDEIIFQNRISFGEKVFAHEGYDAISRFVFSLIASIGKGIEDYILSEIKRAPHSGFNWNFAHVFSPKFDNDGPFVKFPNTISYALKDNEYVTMGKDNAFYIVTDQGITINQELDRYILHGWAKIRFNLDGYTLWEI